MVQLPTLRQLRYLTAVADLRHFGRAADRCAVTQSTLSAGIRELETALAVTLVDRGGHPVALTPVGEDIVARARAILRAAEDLVEAAAAGAEPLSGSLRLGVIPTIGPYLLPAALTALRVVHPRLRLYLREDQTQRLLDQLDDGRLDAVLLALPYDMGDRETMTLGDDDLLVAFAAGHRFAALPAVGDGDLAGEALLLLEDGHCLREHALAACHLGPGRRNEVFQATGMATLVQMVVNGLGVTLLPALAAPVEAAPGRGVEVRPLAGGGRARRIALVWRRGTVRGDDYRRLGEALRAQLPPPADRARLISDAQGA
jgi:LysR family hydrogen peroxide-inducible transcriptional activator